MWFCLRLNLVSDVGEKCDVTGSLDSESQLSLVLSAGTGDSSGEDLASFGSALGQSLGVLVVDVIDTVSTEGANFLSSVSVGTLHSLGSRFGSFL